MYLQKKRIVFVAAALILFVVGCTNNKPAPKVASSADIPGYAVSYPGEMSEQLTRYSDHTVDVKDNQAVFKTYPEALKDPDWQAVAAVYKRADQAGRGQAFADKMAQDRLVKQFFEEEKEDLARRINGSVSNAVKKSDCNCEPETHGAVVFGLKDGVEKRLEKRLLEATGAEDLEAEHEKTIGKKNTKPLSEQAVMISYSAYVVFVELPTIYQDLERRLGESGRVKKTLEAELERAQAKTASPDVSKAEKKDAEKQIAAINESLSTISIFEEEAKQLIKRAEKEIPEIQKSYEAAFGTLIDDVEARIQK